MFAQLLESADAAAKNILNNPAVAAFAAELRRDAAAFPGSLEQPLRQASADAVTVANASVAAANECAPLVVAWKGGSTQAAAQILGKLQGLAARLQQNQQENQSAFQSMSAYRDQILKDQRSVAAAANDLRARQKALEQMVVEKQHDLANQQARLRVLQHILIPLPWMVAEIVNLISSGKTMEQQIADIHHQLSDLEGQLYRANSASSAAGGFAAQLNVLEGSLQNLLNSLSVMQGNLQQMVMTLESAASPVLVEAYMATLAAQGKNVIGYLGNT